MNKIKELRKEKELTQTELAIQLNVNQTAVSKWEMGKTLPDTKTLISLSDLFNVSIDYLIGRSTYYFPDNLSNSFSEEELRLIDNYRKLNADEQRLVCDTVNAFNKK